MSQEIGQLQVTLEAQTASFDKGMASAIKSIQKMEAQVAQSNSSFSQISAQFAKVGEAASTFAKALGVVGALSIAKQLAASADAAADTAAGFGIATTEVYAFQRALLASGGQVDGMSKQFGKVSDLITDAFAGVPKAREQLEGLGISLRSIQSSSVSEVYQTLVASIAAIEDPAKRSAVAMELLGKSILGTDIQKLNKQLEDTRQQYKEYENSINAAADAYDNLELAANTASFYATVGVGKATEAIQTLIQQFQNFKDFITGNATLAETIMKPVQQANDRAAESAARAAERVAQVKREIQSLQGVPVSAFDTWTLGLKKSTEEAALFTKKMAYLDEQMKLAVTSDQIKVIQGEMEKLNGKDYFESWKDGIDKSSQAYAMLIPQVEYLAELRNLDMITLEQYNKEIEKLGYGVKTQTTDVDKMFQSLQQSLAGFGQQFSSQFIDNLVEGKATVENFFLDLTKMIAKFMLNQVVQKFITSFMGIAFGAPSLPIQLASTPSGVSASDSDADSASRMAVGNSFSLGASKLQMSVAGMSRAMSSMSIPSMNTSRPQGGYIQQAPTEITINNTMSGDAKVTAAETTNRDGSKSIKIMIEREVKELFGTGAMDKSMRASYGLMRVAT